MEGIKSIQIPPSVKIIKSGALAGCTNLSAIVFPESLETIEDRSLANLPSLEFMSFSGENEKFFVDENSGSLYELTENGAVLIKCPVNLESVLLQSIFYDRRLKTLYHYHKNQYKHQFCLVQTLP